MFKGPLQLTAPAMLFSDTLNWNHFCFVPMIQP